VQCITGLFELRESDLYAGQTACFRCLAFNVTSVLSICLARKNIADSNPILIKVVGDLNIGSITFTTIRRDK
jgi:hypothetical protein